MGKATLARRMAARLLGPRGADREGRPQRCRENLETVAAREKWTAEKRNEDPLQFATHPDFVTFAPDGPLRQISIPQTRLLKEAAQYLPHKGSAARVPDRPRGPRQRAGRQLAAQDAGGAARPPDPDHDGGERVRPAAHHPLARRAVPLRAAGAPRKCGPSCGRARLDQPERRIALAAGSPGIAVSLDLEAYDKRRAAMLALLKVAAGVAPFAAWVPVGEAIGRSKSEKLDCT